CLVIVQMCYVRVEVSDLAPARDSHLHGPHGGAHFPQVHPFAIELERVTITRSNQTGNHVEVRYPLAVTIAFEDSNLICKD
ncbi:MAG: hypothetical protein ACYSW8_28905, partial [Planctomycetota bacterium]